MWGLLISSATVAYSLLTQKVNGGATNASTARELASIDGADRLFFSGVVFGVGIHLLIASVVREFRLWDRVRLYFTADWETGHAPLRSPLQIMQDQRASAPDAAIEGEGTQSATKPHHYGDNGWIRLLVSPETTATSNLQVSVLYLVLGCELAIRRAKAVEFYYVLSGRGSMSQQGVIETVNIRPGDAFVVDPGSIRWVVNRITSRTTESNRMKSNGASLLSLDSHSDQESSEPLILLRATDGGGHPRADDVIRIDPTLPKSSVSGSGSLSSTTVAALSQGLRQVQDMAKDYVRGHKD